MLKRIAALIIAMSMIGSSVSALASNSGELILSGSIVKQVGLYDNRAELNAVTYKEQDTFLEHLISQIKAQQIAGEKCTVVIDGLSEFGLNDDDAQYILDIYSTLIQMFDIMSAKGECNSKNFLEKLTFEIDNTKDVYAFVETFSEIASKRFENQAEDILTVDNFPIATFLNKSAEILERLQFANPKLCYISVSNVDVTASPRYSQVGKNIDLETNPCISLEYLPIDENEYQAFEKKLDEIVESVIYPDMTDAQKAMALHDWIIENTKYGYKLDSSVYGQTNGRADVIFNIESYITLMDMLGGESYETMSESKGYAHTAYAPAMLGYGVCQGYAMLYASLLDKVGIDNGTYISNRLNHQWSLVEIDDLWYHTDVTWDDPVPVVDGSKDGYNTISLSLTDGTKIDLHYQTEDNHNYKNFLMSESTSIDVGHEKDDTALSIPDVECNDDKFHNIDASVSHTKGADYVFASIYYTKLNYCSFNNMYYYEQNVRYNGDSVVWYYKLPFVLKNENGTYAQPVKVTDEEYNAVLAGENPNKGNPEPPVKDEYVTVEIPNENIINNSIDVQCKFEGKEGDELSVNNIGSSVVTLTTKEGAPAEFEVTGVDAYLVYYGLDRKIEKIEKKTVEFADGFEQDIIFEMVKPENALEAQIIVLDSGRALTPVMKAISTASEENYVEASLASFQSGEATKQDFAVILNNAIWGYDMSASACNKWLDENETKIDLYMNIVEDLMKDTALSELEITKESYPEIQKNFREMVNMIDKTAQFTVDKNGEITKQEAIDYFNNVITPEIKTAVDAKYAEEVVAVAKAFGLSLADKIDEVNEAVKAAATAEEKLEAVYNIYNSEK